MRRALPFLFLLLALTVFVYASVPKGALPCAEAYYRMGAQGRIPGVPMTYSYVNGRVYNSGGNAHIIGNMNAGIGGGIASFPQNLGNFVINTVTYPVAMAVADDYIPITNHFANDALNARATATWTRQQIYSGVDKGSLITTSGDLGGNLVAPGVYTRAIGLLRIGAAFPGSKIPVTAGETASTASGKAAHRALAAERRASGDFDPILVTRRVDLKTGKPLPNTGFQTAVPDAVRHEARLILDDKPAGRLVSKDRQEIIRFIRAYEQSKGSLPARIGPLPRRSEPARQNPQNHNGSDRFRGPF